MNTTVILEDTLKVEGRDVTVATVWFAGPLWHHETVVSWAGHRHVVARYAGSMDAIQTHIHWTCWPVLARLVFAEESAE